MTDKELMQMALDALEDVGGEWGFTSQRTLPKRMNVLGGGWNERLIQ